MAVDTEEEKRQLQKLLREFESNVGMAGFVCGRPVELMPEAERTRLWDGFWIEGNLRVLKESSKKLAVTKNLDLTDSEAAKIERAIPTISELIEGFSAYLEGSLGKEELQKKVRQLLTIPIPDSEEGLIHSLSHLIETVHFLAEQDLEHKDSWDRMIDCAQMHDALKRTVDVCRALQSTTGNNLGRGGTIEETCKLAEESCTFLETFFAGQSSSEPLQNHFKTLSAGMQSLWAE